MGFCYFLIFIFVFCLDYLCVSISICTLHTLYKVDNGKTYVCMVISLILEFRGKFLRIARDIARKNSRIAPGFARQMLGIRGELRGLRGKFRKNSLKYCIILKKFRTNFEILHGQNPKNVPLSANSI